MRPIIAGILIALSAISNVSADNLNNQKLCAVQAQHFYSDWKSNSNIPLSTFINHYNIKIDKCIIMIHWMMPEKDGELVGKSVSDAFEGTNYAGYEKFIDFNAKKIFIPNRATAMSHQQDLWRPAILFVGR